MQSEAYPRQAHRPAGPFRRHPRRLLSVPITVRSLMAGGIRASHGITLDLSEGGVGIVVEGGIGVGHTVEIELKLPDRELSVVAIVRHSSSMRSGCEFFGLHADERAYLAEVVGRA